MGFLSQLRSAIRDRLVADSTLGDATILLETKGDIENEIARALGALTSQGGKAGLAIVVMTARASVRERNVPGPYLDPVVVAVHVEEHVVINQGADGTQVTCSDAAERVSALLHRWTPDGLVRPLLADSGQHIQVVQPVMGDIAYAVLFTTSGGLSVTLSQAATPAISPAGGAAPQTVTLTCATAGAAIFYTVDGKTPTPLAGTLYTAPISVAAACTLKAAAYLAGYLTSETATQAYT